MGPCSIMLQQEVTEVDLGHNGGPQALLSRCHQQGGICGCADKVAPERWMEKRSLTGLERFVKNERSKVTFRTTHFFP